MSSARSALLSAGCLLLVCLAIRVEANFQPPGPILPQARSAVAQNSLLGSLGSASLKPAVRSLPMPPKPINVILKASNSANQAPLDAKMTSGESGHPLVKFSAATQAKIVAVADFMVLVHRLLCWWAKYSQQRAAMVARLGPKAALKPYELITRVYGAVDRKLLVDQCEQLKKSGETGAAESGRQLLDENGAQVGEFILVALEEVVRRLELHLSSWSSLEESDAIEDDENPDKLARKRREDAALSRVRLTAVKTAARLLGERTSDIARGAIIHGIVSTLLGQAPTITSSFMQPLVSSVVYSATNSEANAFLADIKSRAAERSGGASLSLECEQLEQQQRLEEEEDARQEQEERQKEEQ